MLLELRCRVSAVKCSETKKRVKILEYYEKNLQLSTERRMQLHLSTES